MSDDDLVASWTIIAGAVARTHERILQTIDVGGDSPAWFTVLSLLLRNPEHRLPMNQLARELSMTTGGFTKLADRMGREGLIDRRGSFDDRRVIYATLTDAGLAVAERSDGEYKAALRVHVLDVLTPVRLAALADGAGLLQAAVAGPERDGRPPSDELLVKPRPAGDRRERRRTTRD
jgi:DNA-binding MarR family transcriptional regulator